MFDDIMYILIPFFLNIKTKEEVFLQNVYDTITRFSIGVDNNIRIRFDKTF